ncbi:MAG: hypothetical protein LC778_01610 [Acidobacteria bacterium]|nr:hypothetical protein [Acidobacteriota bacterium]
MTKKNVNEVSEGRCPPSPRPGNKTSATTNISDDVENPEILDINTIESESGRCPPKADRKFESHESGRCPPKT